MGGSKNIIILVLVLALVVVAGWAYYVLMVSGPDKAEAACKAKIDSEVVPQMTAVAEKACAAKCTELVSQCQQTVQQIMQVPACAAAMAP